MDELYSNLENYNEVNIVEELKNENNELKYKLEEYSNTMKQLQTDFDRLNSEYKKLEYNYSSLLKTARAEIERKTQLITNLNREKDILVIRSMQNGQKNILNNLTHNTNRGVYNKIDNNKNEGDKELTKLNKNKLGVKTETKEVPRIEPQLLSPIESESSIGTTNKSTSSENNMRTTSNKHCSESKKNILKNVLDQQHKDRQTDKSKPIKIMDRRKSMPVLSNFEEQFSSDEEQTDNLKLHEDYDKKSKKDLGYGRTQKTSEQTGYDSKNNYNSKRYTEKYDSYTDHHSRSRYHMHHRYSPERDRYKSYRGKDYSYRPDYRQRMKSPPMDKYDPDKSRNRRYREKDYEWDSDSYNIKHSRNDYDSEERAYLKEPDVKRRRIESTSTDTERFDRFVDRKSLKQSEYNVDVYEDYRTSCQSPDYDQIESSLHQHFTKEIKNTATVKLEDPRITSKKYLPDKSDKGSFITAVGINVPIIPIDKSRWGLEIVEVPEALKEKPSVVTTNDLLNFIYKDIDEPSQSMSVKDNRQDMHIDSKSYTHLAPATPTQSKCNYKENISLTKVYDENDLSIKANDKVCKTPSSHYTIPKKSKTDSNINKLHLEEDIKKETYTDHKNIRKDEPLLSASLGCIIDSQNNEHSSNIELNNRARRLTPNKDNVAGDLELSDEASDIMDDILTTDRNDSKLKINASDDTRILMDEIPKDDHKSKTVKNNKHLEKNKQKSSEDVDDKRSEHVDVAIEVLKEKEKNSENVDEVQKTVCSVDNIKINPSENYCRIVKEKNPKHEEESKKKSAKKKREEKERLDKCDKTKTTKGTKKREKKKKTSKDDKDNEKNDIVSQEKNTKDEIKSSKPKNKFTELFGESSSLITPDDLGIVKYNINTERHDNYSSLFENTQDAIDLNVREIQKIQNTEEISSDTGLLPKTTTEDNSQTPYAIDNKSQFQVEEKHSAYNMFKNLTPAPIDTEPNVVKMVVISSGVQNSVEEKELSQKKLPDKNNIEIDKEKERVVNKPLPIQLLRAVATSTPNKTQCEISSRLSEESGSKGESFSNADVSMSDTGPSPATNIDVAENNAPDVRIFLKRRRKIRKT